jgi:hypothetical protein
MEEENNVNTTKRHISFAPMSVDDITKDASFINDDPEEREERFSFICFF